jgi:hypothetical protein
MVSKKRLDKYIKYYEDFFKLKKVTVPESRRNISYTQDYAKFVLNNKKDIKSFTKKETVELKLTKAIDMCLFDLCLFKQRMCYNNLRYYSLLMNFVTEKDIIAGNKNGQSLSKFITKEYDAYCKEGNIYNDSYFIVDFNSAFSAANQNNVPVTTFPLYLTLTYAPEAFVSLGLLGPDSGSCFSEHVGGNYFRKHEIAFQPGAAVFCISTKPNVFSIEKEAPQVLSRSLVVLDNNKFNIFNSYCVNDKVSKLACVKLFDLFLNKKLNINIKKTSTEAIFTSRFYNNGDVSSYEIQK